MRSIQIAAVTALALTAATSAAFAGGEKCRKAAHAKAASHEVCQASAEECLSAMAAKIASKGWIGIETEKDRAGHYRVSVVEANSPAQAAGLRQGDVLLAMNGLDLYAEDKSALKQAKAQLAVGSEVSYTVKRDASEQTVRVTLAQVPENVMARWIGQHMLDQHAHAEVASAG